MLSKTNPLRFLLSFCLRDSHTLCTFGTCSKADFSRMPSLYSQEWNGHSFLQISYGYIIMIVLYQILFAKSTVFKNHSWLCLTKVNSTVKFTLRINFDKLFIKKENLYIFLSKKRNCVLLFCAFNDILMIGNAEFSVQRRKAAKVFLVLGKNKKK